MNGKQSEGAKEEMEGLMRTGGKHCLQQTSRLKQGKIDGYAVRCVVLSVKRVGGN